MQFSRDVLKSWKHKAIVDSALQKDQGSSSNFFPEIFVSSSNMHASITVMSM
jgi:hypothetical protein